MTYSRVANHGTMLFDATRNRAYARAIASATRADAVVLDLGAGLGIHGLLAAAAGATRVYLVEPQPVVQAAAATAAIAKFGARVQIMQDRIEDVELPERVDLIISVFTGNLLFSEDLLPSLFHARDKFLKPGGTLLPDRAQLWLAPLSAPELHASHVARWSEPVMGLDYSHARQFAANEILWLRREEFAGSTRLAGGAILADIDLSTATHADCKAQAQCKVEADGLCHGLLAWTRIRLGDEWLSTDPDAPPVHWSPVMLPIDPPLPLAAGEMIELALQRPAFGDWTWSVKAQAGTRRHSTFLARSDAARELAKVAPHISPGLSPEGRRAARILELLAQGLSNQAIAKTLAQEDASDPANCLREVQKLAMRYGGRS
jgi:SAM-dependent methyltransferase